MVFKFQKNGNIGELKDCIAAKCSISRRKIAIADIYNNRIYAFLSETKDLSTIKSTDETYAFELPFETSNDQYLRVQCMQRKLKQKQLSNYFTSTQSIKLFGVPFVIFFEQKVATGIDLYNIIWNRVKKFTERLNDDMSVDEKNHKFPFILSVVTSTGNGCGLCSTSSCLGCELKCNDKPITLKSNGHTLAIDWNLKILKENFNSELPKTIDTDPTVEENKDIKKKNLELVDCLKLFTTNEKLGPNDPWYCPKCKEFQRAMKKFDLWKVPQILVVHLKRFQYSKWSREKLNAPISFPIDSLDLSSFVKSKQNSLPIYDLFAISTHYGGLGGGHYCCEAKNCISKKWYIYDDSQVTETNLEQLKNCQAYVLFYQKRQ